MSTFGNYVVFDPAKVADLLRGPDGPVARDLMRKGDLVRDEARRRVGVYSPPDAYSAGNRGRKPGQLRDSIVKRLADQGGELQVLVGSDDPIALLHHEGTVPHIIRPRNKPMLVFYWPAVGRVVAFREVNHPGTQPNRYLTDALSVLR